MSTNYEQRALQGKFHIPPKQLPIFPRQKIYHVDQVNGELLVLIKMSAELSDLPVNLHMTVRFFTRLLKCFRAPKGHNNFRVAKPGWSHLFLRPVLLPALPPAAAATPVDVLVPLPRVRPKRRLRGRRPGCPCPGRRRRRRRRSPRRVVRPPQRPAAPARPSPASEGPDGRAAAAEPVVASPPAAEAAPDVGRTSAAIAEAAAGGASAGWLVALALLVTAIAQTVRKKSGGNKKILVQ